MRQLICLGSILAFSACASSQSEKPDPVSLNSPVPPDAVISYDSRADRPSPAKLFSDGSAAGDVSEWALLTSADLIRTLPDVNAFGEVYKPSSNREKMMVLNVSVITAFAKQCDMDWESKNFTPFMQWQRSRTDLEGNPSMTATMHGIYQGYIGSWLSENEVDCNKIEPLLENNLFGDTF